MKPSLRHAALWLCPSALLLALAACASVPNPYTIPDGRYYGRVTMNRYPVVVSKIDGVSNTQSAPLIEPGTHVLTLISLGPRLGHIPREETLTLEMKPCMRYILAAQHDNGITERFKPLVDQEEASAGCKSS